MVSCSACFLAGFAKLFRRSITCIVVWVLVLNSFMRASIISVSLLSVFNCLMTIVLSYAFQSNIAPNLAVLLISAYHLPSRIYTGSLTTSAISVRLNRPCYIDSLYISRSSNMFVCYWAVIFLNIGVIIY